MVEKALEKSFFFSQPDASKRHLAKLSRKKYGERKDQRSLGWEEAFSHVSGKVARGAEVESDQNPFYPQYVRTWFKEPKYRPSPGQRGSTTGQGELKKVRFDPLFSINHTCAMLRANINRLFRKTWCTTKKRERLSAHLEIYMHYHNTELIKKVS